MLKNKVKLMTAIFKAQEVSTGRCSKSQWLEAHEDYTRKLEIIIFLVLSQVKRLEPTSFVFVVVRATTIISIHASQNIVTHFVIFFKCYHYNTKYPIEEEYF
jgi:hypothetical protein